MLTRLFTAVSLSVLLSGCGTLQINIEYGAVTPSAVPATPSYRSERMGATEYPAATPTAPALPTATLTYTAALSASPAGSAVVGLAASRYHTCAWLSDGAVKCWGNNEHGQLGDGSMVNRNVPADVAGLTGVKAVTAGWGRVCALTQSGAVKCWGCNEFGQLGDGKNSDSSTPVDVVGPPAGMIAIDAGDYHTCAVTSSDRLRCWGKNVYGQLADWTKANSNVPVESPFFGGSVADVAAVHLRHQHAEDDEVGMDFSDLLQRLLAVRSALHPISGAPQKRAQVFRDGGFVVDQEDMRCGLGHEG
jgi:hypothetical protein